jgi:hypothetical protein
MTTDYEARRRADQTAELTAYRDKHVPRHGQPDADPDAVTEPIPAAAAPPRWTAKDLHAVYPAAKRLVADWDLSPAEWVLLCAAGLVAAVAALVCLARLAMAVWPS